MNPHYRITREPLDTHGAELISIYFRFGGNFFVFVYPKDGVSKYTLIDAGDVHHAGTLPSILAEIKIERKNIERVIITHSHPDHYGLAHLLVKGSQAKIMVHANFKRIVDAHKNSIERSWFGMYSTEELKKCNVEYLSPENGYGVIEIGGVKFPRLSLPIPIGDTGKLEVLAVPEVGETHTHDQVIALYSARDFAGSIAAPKGYRPSDDLLFSGDLWLMRGPRYDRKMKNPTFYMRRILYRIRT
jgi:glyoxylase-like metal-dependent hydrolase (beta-lactamase superfamily II)